MEEGNVGRGERLIETVISVRVGVQVGIYIFLSDCISQRALLAKPRVEGSCRIPSKKIWNI